jgi:hypothetical protein
MYLQPRSLIRSTAVTRRLREHLEHARLRVDQELERLEAVNRASTASLPDFVPVALYRRGNRNDVPARSSSPPDHLEGADSESTEDVGLSPTKLLRQLAGRARPARADETGELVG